MKSASSKARSISSKVGDLGSRREAEEEEGRCLERMLGTAMMLAALDVKGVLRKQQLQVFLAKAGSVEWERPAHREFSFFYELFKQLIMGVDGAASWLKLMQNTRCADPRGARPPPREAAERSRTARRAPRRGRGRDPQGSKPPATRAPSPRARTPRR